MDLDEILAVWEEKKDQLGKRIRKMTGRSEIVEDLLQDIFVKFYQKAGKLESSYAGRYLMRSATNIAVGAKSSKIFSRISL